MVSRPTGDALQNVLNCVHSASEGQGVGKPGCGSTLGSPLSPGVALEDDAVVLTGLECESGGDGLPTFLTSCSTKASTRTMRSPICWPRSAGREASSGYSWLRQCVPRRWQPMHTASAAEPKLHRIFRRLHSQQLFVPFRIFRRLASGDSTSEPLGRLTPLTSSGSEVLRIKGLSIIPTLFFGWDFEDVYVRNAPGDDSLTYGISPTSTWTLAPCITNSALSQLGSPKG